MNEHLPSEIVDPEQIEEIVNTINDMGIPVYEKAPDNESILAPEPSTPTDEEAIEEAAAALEKAGKLQPFNPHALYELGMTYYRLERYDKVQRAIERLNEFDPKATMQLMKDTPERVPALQQQDRT